MFTRRHDADAALHWAGHGFSSAHAVPWILQHLRRMGNVLLSMLRMGRLLQTPICFLFTENDWPKLGGEDSCVR